MQRKFKIYARNILSGNQASNEKLDCLNCIREGNFIKVTNIRYDQVPNLIVNLYKIKDYVIEIENSKENYLNEKTCLNTLNFMFMCYDRNDNSAIFCLKNNVLNFI